MARTLLLADDSVTIQRVIELTFADEDIRVIAVGDGQQAIARIDADRPDVVLADVGMPERDGYEVAAHVKGHPELAHIPVLLLTGAFEPVDEARARQSGCDGVLVKPFEPQMVINRVKDLLAGRRPAALGSTRQGPGPAGGSSRSEETPQAHDESMDRLMDVPTTPADPGRSGVPSDTLEDYFDRLDAAFSTEGGVSPSGGAETPLVVPQAQPAADLGADFGSWDLSTGATRLSSRSSGEPPATDDHPPPAPAEAHAGAQRVGPTPPPDVHRPETSSGPAPSHVLADVFAALLTAEQRVASLATQPASIELPEGAVDEIVRRVVARMSDDAVRATVLDVAERLVREEIERIKNA